MKINVFYKFLRDVVFVLEVLKRSNNSTNRHIYGIQTMSFLAFKNEQIFICFLPHLFRSMILLFTPFFFVNISMYFFFFIFNGPYLCKNQMRTIDFIGDLNFMSTFDRFMLNWNSCFLTNILIVIFWK